MSDVTTLLDRRYALKESIKELTNEVETIENDIMCKMMESGAKVAEDSNGIRYTMGVTTSYEILPQVYRYLENKGLLGEFVKPAKVTKSGIDKLLKEEKISFADMAEIESGIISNQGSYYLKSTAKKGK